MTDTDAFIQEIEDNLAADWERINQHSIDKYGIPHQERVDQFNEQSQQSIEEERQRNPHHSGHPHYPRYNISGPTLDDTLLEIDNDD